MPRFASPVLQRFDEIARRLWESDPALQQRFDAPTSLAYWGWLITDGLAEHEVLRDAWPTPPDALVQTVIGGDGVQRFRESAVSDAYNVYCGLIDAGADPSVPSRFLDFGCGCGRLLSALAFLSQRWSLHGTDVDERAARWCARELDYAAIVHGAERPPTVFPNGHFDALVAFSVFSHLPLERQQEWFAELRRITAPGAAVVLTVQGQHSFDRCATGDFADPSLPSLAQLRSDVETLERDGFVYYPYRTGRPWDADEPSTDYGRSFQTESFVRRTFAEHFDVLHVRLAPQGWQDYVILRRGDAD